MRTYALKTGKNPKKYQVAVDTVPILGGRVGCRSDAHDVINDRVDPERPQRFSIVDVHQMRVVFDRVM